MIPLMVHATTFQCGAGDVPCLIAAIAKANSNGDPHNTLRLAAGTFPLVTIDNTPLNDGPNGLPLVTSALTITGQGAGQTIIERQPTAPFFRLLAVAPTGTLTLQSLTLQGGEVDIRLFGRGGGIRNEGRLTIRASVITNNSAWIGGGIDNLGTLVLTHSALTENFADFVAAGLAAIGPTRIDHSLIADNVAEEESGLGFDPGAGEIVIRHSVISGNIATLNTGGGMGGVGTVTIHKTIFTDNVAGVRGGAINLDNGALTLTQSALIGNVAAHFGGGLFVEAGTVSVQHAAITTNVAGAVFGGVGGGIFNSGGTVELQHSILAENQAPESPDCAGEVTVRGHTLIGDPTGCRIEVLHRDPSHD
jgi:hypothetical protein